MRPNLTAIVAGAAILAGSENISASPRQNYSAQRGYTVQARNTLDQYVVEEVSKKTGKPKDNYSVVRVRYGPEFNPLGDGYVKVNYIAVKDKKKGDIFLYSEQGSYLGKIWPTGKKPIWKSQESGSSTVTTFHWFANNTIEVIERK